ncbi:unnamed protein product, partial [Oikopleura dioica]
MSKNLDDTINLIVSLETLRDKLHQRRSIYAPTVRNESEILDSMRKLVRDQEQKVKKMTTTLDIFRSETRKVINQIEELEKH